MALFGMGWHRNALHRLYGVALYVMVWHSMAWLGYIDHTYTRGRTEDIISYFTLMSSEIHYYDIIEKMGSWTLMSSEV